MSNYACKRCGAEERNHRGDCLACKRAARNAAYARQVGRAPEPAIKPSTRGPLWRLDECDAEPDAAKKRALMAALWGEFVAQEWFHDEPTLDEIHMNEMRDMPEPERSTFSDAGHAEFMTRQRATRLGRK